MGVTGRPAQGQWHLLTEPGRPEQWWGGLGALQGGWPGQWPELTALCFSMVSSFSVAFLLPLRAWAASPPTHARVP